MSEDIEKVLNQILALKAGAKSARVDGDLESALDDLNESVDLLRECILKATNRRLHGRLTAELADSFGMIGGIEKRVGLALEGSNRHRHLVNSVTAYDKGFTLEADLKINDATTYNRINRLVGRVLLDPRVLTHGVEAGFSMEDELREAEEILAEQLKSARQGDPWGYCDLATIRLLRGADAWSPINDLERLRPQRFVYESALATLEPLSEVASSVRPEFSEAVTRMRRSARYAVP